MQLSIIIPAYNEQDNISPFYAALKKSLAKTDLSAEIVFVDDGSTDGTSSEILKLRVSDKNVKLIQFQRNFGKAAALSAGFEHSTGEQIITMDADLQDDPAEIPKFIAALKNADLIVGWKRDRKDPVTKTLPSKFFNALTRVLTGVRVHDSNCGFKAYRRQVVENISIYGELHRYIPALAHWKGFSVDELVVLHHPRLHGKSKYGISRLSKGFFDLLTVKFLSTYTRRPLHFFGPIGALTSLLGLVFGAYLFWLWITGQGIGNRPLLFLSVLLIVVGVQFVSLGLLGEMVANNNQKKEFVIKKVVG
ncbi:MAG TPA: glycosyltransferase family 2 protein [Candidatus Nanoarchaeia archaeon]|nr:glycosyltransferase family 2 protein [Candidatus Nanoarchaeia archaeon]